MPKGKKPTGGTKSSASEQEPSAVQYHPAASEIARSIEEHKFDIAQCYVAFADIYLDAGGRFTDEVLNSYLLGKTFDFAVAVDWIPPMDVENGLPLGEWSITSQYRKAFIGCLEDLGIVNGLTIELSDNPEWDEPTPASILKRFQDDTKLTNADIVRKMNQLRYTCDMKTFLRIKHPPKALRATRIETVLRLHQVIVAESPELFKDLNYRHLFWRRKQ